MADYKVVCVERRPAAGHHHITGVGVMRGSRAPEHKSVKDVRRAIKDKKDRFYTVDKCCGEKTISSFTGESRADILAALSSCNRMTWYLVR
jgi:hypothetical protein